MYIKGITDYNKQGESRETGLFAGLVSQDGELRSTQSGKQYATASVRAFNRKDGTAAFMTLKSFQSDLSALLSNLRKGDRILAAGVVETREYNGKIYTDMLVDFIVPGDQLPAVSGAQTANRANLESRMASAGMAPDDGFAPISGEDGELPF